MRRERLRCNVSSGNKEKLIKLAEAEGLSEEEYLNQICKHVIIFVDDNMLRYFKWKKIKNPFGDNKDTLYIKNRTKQNTEELSVYLPNGHVNKLKQKALKEGFRSYGKLGAFIDKVCDYPIIVLNGDGGKNGTRK